MSIKPNPMGGWKAFIWSWWWSYCWCVKGIFTDKFLEERVTDRKRKSLNKRIKWFSPARHLVCTKCTNICLFCFTDRDYLGPNYQQHLPRDWRLCHMITTPPQLLQEGMQCRCEWQAAWANKLHTEPSSSPRHGQPPTQKEGPKAELTTTAAAAAVWCCNIQGALSLQEPQWD